MASSPVKGYITSEWGQYRGSYRHLGMDLGVGGVYGTPVYAMESGTLVRSVGTRVHDTNLSQPKNYGKAQMLPGRTGNGQAIKSSVKSTRTIYYLHVKPVPGLKVGERVVAGQLIGYIDDSGNTSGAHLHLEVHENGVSVNPRGWFSIYGITPGAAPRKAVAAAVPKTSSLPVGMRFQTTERVNVRASASLTGRVRRVIPKGYKFRVVKTGIRSGGITWVKTAHGSYIAQKYVKFIGDRYQTTARVNVRSGASTTSKIKNTIPKGYKFRGKKVVTKNGRKWIYTSKGNFVAADYVKRIG